ncbi:hypothetical protein ACJ73_06169 [Blastomyces percursus]|uniref:Uncharacterized protein n=1 Tax=Blastomyces percursus TaxID=1658174 RepID=A0A1J9QQJ9_9EURO|nr:hypothetical protein ACJ73_06169 [Blastomyces percursus]
MYRWASTRQGHFVSSVTEGKVVSYKWKIEATDSLNGPPNIYLKAAIQIDDSPRKVHEDAGSISLAPMWRADGDDSCSAYLEVRTVPMPESGYMKLSFQFEEWNGTGSTVIGDFETLAVLGPIMNGTDDG